jgi:hypothetical protein
MKPNHDEIGVGATEDLDLRVSVATLVRVLFKDPRDGDLMLALERKATVHKAESGAVVVVKSQPFGGAIRILDVNTMRGLIGDFHFDSEHSRSEQDFRIFIRASDWETVRESCVQHLNRIRDPILETDPARELTEEFADALNLSLKPDQYSHNPVAIVAGNAPVPTENIYAKGVPTARIYRIFEATISDTSLAFAMLTSSESHSDQDLCDLALRDAQEGGRGRANAILALPLKLVSDVYSAIPLEERNAPILFEKNRLDETVASVLDIPFHRATSGQ